ELELRERSPPFIQTVLRLPVQLVEAVRDRPHFLFLGERAEVTLAAPVGARAADPLIEHSAVLEIDAIVELRDEIRQLRVALLRAQLVRDLERDRHDRARVVGQRRLGHQDLMIAIGETLDHLGRGLLPGEVEKEFLDVLDFERALVQPVLLQEVFHNRPTIAGCRAGSAGGPHRFVGRRAGVSDIAPPTAATTTPATAGPATRAPLTIDEFNAIALSRCSRLPTISITNACRAGMSNAFATPSSDPRTKRCHTLTVPASVIAARTNARTIMADCVPMRTRRRFARSATTPPSGDSRKTG